TARRAAARPRAPEVVDPGERGSERVARASPGEASKPEKKRRSRPAAKRASARRVSAAASDDPSGSEPVRNGKRASARRARRAPPAIPPAEVEPPRPSRPSASRRPPASRDPHAEEREGAILVTGICGRLGRLLARKLHRVDRVVGIDRRPFRGKPKDIVHHEIDLRRKKTRDVFRAGGIRAVVHLGIMHDPRASAKAHHAWNVVAFQKLLDYMTQYDVPKLVVLSSANVYGPSPDNPQFLTEEAPLLGAQHFSAIRDLVEVDMLAQSFFWRHPDTETVVLRPCHILGGVHNAPSNYLRLERPVTLMGFDPMVQVIHERDVVDAIQLALQPGVRGIFNLKGPGEIPMSRAFRILGRRPRPVPSSVAHTVIDRLWRYRMTSFPTPELDHIRYVCMVDDTRAREILGFRPRFSLEDTVKAIELDA
ncbi:MAG TPA: SDR family oxidoreductase, partial [Sandaracinaceae bacterium LLY-WYZ-13_1]|nr:SDR family oxidoreductase [Sandaracinaceae bacterium LLY-WYZ-13_1]